MWTFGVHVVVSRGHSMGGVLAVSVMKIPWSVTFTPIAMSTWAHYKLLQSYVYLRLSMSAFWLISGDPINITSNRVYLKCFPKLRAAISSFLHRFFVSWVAICGCGGLRGGFFTGELAQLRSTAGDESISLLRDQRGGPFGRSAVAGACIVYAGLRSVSPGFTTW